MLSESLFGLVLWLWLRWLSFRQLKDLKILKKDYKLLEKSKEDLPELLKQQH